MDFHLKFVLETHFTLDYHEHVQTSVKFLKHVGDMKKQAKMVQWFL
jgi:hypothetical protein